MFDTIYKKYSNLKANKKLLNIVYITLYLLFFSICCFLVLYNLGGTNIQSWDEARHGINAYEMIQNNNFIISTYKYQPDFYNLKPPLSYWLIAISYKLFGFNTYSLRLYSAISFILLILISSHFLRKQYGKLSSLIFVFVFAGFKVFIFNNHIARAGDADMIYILFYTISLLAMLNILFKPKLIYLCAFSTSIAFLLKSYHIISLLMTVFIFLLITKNLSKIKFKSWIISLLIFLIPLFIWFLWRYTQDGLIFFKAMIEIDVISRTSSFIEQHIEGPFFYFVELIKMKSMYIIFITIILCTIYGILKKKKYILKNPTILGLILWIIIPLILFSFSKTKLIWYIYPIFPALLILFTIYITLIFRNFNNTDFQYTNKLKYIALFLIIIFFANSISILSNISKIYTKSTLTSSTKQDLEKILIENVNRINDSGKIVYIQTSNTSTWTQDQILAAELYGNLIVDDGGFNKWLKNTENSIIILDKNYYHLNVDKIISNKFNITYSESSNWIIIK